MLTKAVAVVAGIVLAAVGVSMAIGLTAPDGTVGESARAAPTQRPSASPEPLEPAPTSDVAPASVSGTWPGRPAAVTVDGSAVDWCPAVTTEASAEAVEQFGREQVESAACAAVSFVFDHRYSRLSLPRSSYERGDFDEVLSALSRTTVNAVYRSRIADFVSSPSNTGAKRLGLVLLRSAGEDHEFYGTKNSADGYDDRAVWINPRWSTVVVGVDRAKATPRLTARLTAQASIPVFATEAGRDDMLTIPTTATFFLRDEMGRWVIGGWTIDSGRSSLDPLAVL
ncbi:MAG: hypothetical protein WB508_09060 [Aeromicrobium sp.]|uniref:hypothetical protein n=1 Tax=Aeromicrobium sp. TaxID=1871063 RepID=UPI003C39DBB9